MNPPSALSVAKALGKLLEISGLEPIGHTERVSDTTVLIAEAMAMDSQTVEALRLAGFLHDIGKFALPEHLSTESGQLQTEEWTLIEQHALVGAACLSQSALIPGLAIEAIAAHHERWDGLGYPLGLAASQIPSHANVLAVADMYCSLTADWWHRRALPGEQAARIVLAEAGAAFDPQVIAAFMDALRYENLTPSVRRPARRRVGGYAKWPLRQPDLVVTDLTGASVLISPIVAQRLGTLDTPLGDWVHAEDFERVRSMIGTRWRRSQQWQPVDVRLGRPQQWRLHRVNLSFHHGPEPLFVARLEEHPGSLFALQNTRRLNSRLSLLEAAIAASSDGVIVVDSNRLIVEVNRGALELHAYADTAMLGQPLSSIYAASSDPRTMDELETLLGSGLSGQLELQLRGQDHRTKWIDMRFDPVRDEYEQVSHWLVIERDVTAQREAEREKRRVLTLTNDIILETDSAGCVTSINPVVEDLLGSKPEALIGHPIESWLGHQATNLKLQPLPNGRGYSSRFRSEAHDAAGQIHWIDWQVTIYPSDGRTYWVGRDVTEQHAAQLVRDDLARVSNEQRVFFQSVLTHLPAAVIVSDDKGNISYTNTRGSALLTSAPDDKLGAELERWGEIARNAMVGVRGSPVELKVVRQSGNIDFHVNAIALVDQSRALMVATDVTEQLRVGREVAAAQARNQLMFEQSNIGFALTDTDGHMIEINSALAAMLNQNPQALIGHAFSGFTVKDAVSEAFVQQWRAAEHVTNRELRLERSHSQPLWVSVSGGPLLDVEGSIIGHTIACFDIDLRKRDEERLRLLESVVVSSQDAVLITDVGGDGLEPRIIYINEAFTRITGYTLEDIQYRNPRIFQGVDTAVETRAELRRAIIEQRSITVEIVNYRKDGTPFWAELSVTPVFNNDGHCTHFESIERDISERKRLEREQGQRELALENLHRATQQQAYALRLRDRVNTLMGSITDFPELVSQVLQSLVKEFGIEKAQFFENLSGRWTLCKSFGEVTGDAVTSELTLSPGSRRLVMPAGDPSGTVAALVCMVIPEQHVLHITQALNAVALQLGHAHAQWQLKADKAWRESQYQSVLESLTEVVCRLDHDGRLELLNHSWETLTGYTVAESLGRPLLSFVRGQTRWKLIRELGRLKRFGRTVFDLHSESLNGTPVWLEVRADIEPKPDQSWGIVATILDITERYRAEQSLVYSEQRFQALVHLNSDIITVVEPSSKIVYKSPSAKYLLGCDPSEVLGQPLLDFVHPDDRTLFANWLTLIRDQVPHEGEPQVHTLVYRHTLFSGGWRWLETFGSNHISHPAVNGVVLNSRDVTEQRQAAAEVSQLLDAIIRAEEIERERIALDLHDGPAQSMVSAMRFIEAIRTMPPGNRTTIQQHLDRSAGLLAESIRQVRGTISNLIPPDLEVLGLRVIMEQLISHIAAEEGWAFINNLETISMPRNVEVIYYRIFGEALQNIRKHAAATLVTVTLQQRDHGVVLEVNDNGCGFQPDRTISPNQDGTQIGLLGMRRRAELVDCTFEAQSTPGLGTTITLIYQPLTPNRSDSWTAHPQT